MNTKNTLLIAGLSIGFLALSATPVFAGCTNSYGTSVECPANNLVVNKKVRHPVNMNVFVENLTSNDTAYSPSDTVEYDIAVSNTSNVDYSEVTVSDTLPSYLTFTAGPGTYNASTRVLTFTLPNLKAGTTVHTRFTAKVAETSAFPTANDLTCDIKNYVKATGPDGKTSEDTASLCVQTKVLGATTLPVAGFNDLAVSLPFALAGISGLLIMANKRKVQP
ncbi:DUF11 domain-containing protein [Candidatus Woesebacteria bacterium]|nr:DUF11 domain-containing protein [Candidatus Woesebacteria bacterium]